MKLKPLLIIMMVSKFSVYGIFLQCLFISILFASEGNAQKHRSIKEVELTLNCKRCSLPEAFEKIAAATDFNFSYFSQDLPRTYVSLTPDAGTLEGALISLAKQAGLRFKRINNIITVDVYRRKTFGKKADNNLVIEEKEISGVVTDQEGVPLPGANIFVKNTTIGTVADVEGRYTLLVPEEATTLVFSYVGYLAEEVEIGDRSVININLTPDISTLSEIVVIGYGSAEKSELIGAVSTIKAENIEELPITTFEQALSGQVSGVQLRQTGAPGGGPEVLIRGIGSMTASNAPLYVVDGLPLGNQNSPRDNFILSSIAPQDIESISVLKDAAAKSIYGSRASNGVIIIQTKQGKAGKPTITFGVSTGIQTVPNFEKPDLLTAEGLARFQKERLEDEIAAGATLPPDQQALLDRVQNPEEFGEGTYWFDEILQTAPMTNYNIGVNGGSERARYNISANYLDQEGVVIDTDFRRISFRGNLNVDVTERLRFGMNFAPAQSIAGGGRTDAGSGGFDVFNAVALSWWADPSGRPFDENGDPTNVTQGELLPFYTTNPITLMRERIDERRTNTLQMGSFIELDVIEGLTFKTFGSFNYIDRRNRFFTPSNLPAPGQLSPNPEGTGVASARVAEDTRFNWLFENSLRYRKTFDEVHTIDAFAAFTMEHRERVQTIISANNIIDEFIQWPSSGNVNQDNVNNFTGGAPFGENALVSVVGRVNYAYKNKYYFTGSFRRDGSSVFGSNERYGNFPAFAVAWRISNEPFFERFLDVISELKVEGGYGISGNNSGLSNYQWQGAVVGADYVFGGNQQPGSAIDGVPNTTLTWEDHKETNLGIDIGFFESKVLLNVDYYRIISEDFIFPTPVPVTTGFNSIISNSGRVRNEGVEIDLAISDILKGEFQWSTNLNFTRNRNTVEELDNDIRLAGPAGNGTFFSITRPGYPIGLYQGLMMTGLFTQEELDDPNTPRYPGAREGSLKWVDGDGDGTLEFGEDYLVIGDPHPDFIFGMTHNFSYKNFDLNMVIAGSVGQQIYDQRNQYLQNIDGVFNLLVDIEDRFRPGDDPRTKTIPTTVGRVNRQAWRIPSTITVKDADYMWIRNITLGYTLRGEAVNNIFRNTRVYFSVQNPFLFTEYEGGNPEVARANDGPFVRNVNYGQYPVNRNFTLGVNVTF